MEMDEIGKETREDKGNYIKNKEVVTNPKLKGQNKGDEILHVHPRKIQNAGFQKFVLWMGNDVGQIMK